MSLRSTKAQCIAYYFKKNPGVKNNCECMKCDSRKSLLYCLECAHIGCGRLVNGHARSHYNLTKHSWALNLSTFKIWSYKKSEYLEQNLNNYETPKTSYDTDAPDAIRRHGKMPKLSNDSICMRCGDKQKLWLCLTCGYLGCGRNAKGHARKHYDLTEHHQVMNYKTYAIWDYEDQEYVD